MQMEVQKVKDEKTARRSPAGALHPLATNTDWRWSWRCRLWSPPWTKGGA